MIIHQSSSGFLGSIKIRTYFHGEGTSFVWSWEEGELKGWEEDCESFQLYFTFEFSMRWFSCEERVCNHRKKKRIWRQVIVFILVMKNGWRFFKCLVGVWFHSEYDKMLGIVVHITIIDFCRVHLVVLCLFHKNKMIFTFYSTFRVRDIILPYDNNC